MNRATDRPTDGAAIRASVGSFDSSQRPLCVDLDGTLIRTDLLWESAFEAVRRQPSLLLRLPFMLLRGRASLKSRLAALAVMDVETLPYREELIAFLRREVTTGRRIVLATASDRSLATPIADHLGFFSEVLASDGATNLKGHAKAAALEQRFGRSGFDYVGDSRADIPCWQAAVRAFSVRSAPIRGVPKLEPLPGSEPPPSTGGTAKAIVRALRPHQWVKNLLVAIPMLAAHRFDTRSVAACFLAFVCFSACASGGYILNDLLDVRSDRRHPRKRHRPFASGELSAATGSVLLVALWTAGLSIAVVALPAVFTGLLLLYLAGSLAYSWRLKREPALDVMVLAALYVCRVVAGGHAVGVFVSAWLLAFTMFVSLSLAYMKRFTELRDHPETSATIPGRGYVGLDAHWLQSAGLTSAYLAVVVLALYANIPEVSRLYTNPDRLLFICAILLYWSTHIWLNALRRKSHADPVVAVVTDPVTYLAIASSSGAVISAL